MATPHARVDVICVPSDRSSRVDPDRFAAAWSDWSAGGFVEDTAALGTFIDGGAKRVRLDLPERPAFYGNQSGGVAVRCPQTGAPVARALARSVESWKAGGAFELDCPSCGDTHALDALAYRPPVAFGRCAVFFEDVGGVVITPAGRELLLALLGDFTVVLRRVS